MRGWCLLGHVVLAAGGNRAIKSAVDLHPVSVDALCRVFLCRLAFQTFRAECKVPGSMRMQHMQCLRASHKLAS